MSKLADLEKKIYILENQLKDLSKNKSLIQKKYDSALEENLQKLNIVKKSLDYEHRRYLGLDKEETPKTVTTISYEDALLNHIKKSIEFVDCVKCLEEGTVKSMSLEYNIQKLKKITSELERIPGVGMTRPVDGGLKSSEGRERVEREIKKKDYVKTKEVTGSCYTYE